MKIGFLSHSDMSIYYFRRGVMRALKERGHEVVAIMPKGAFYEQIASEFEVAIYNIEGASTNPLKVGSNALSLANALAPLRLDALQSAAHKSNIFGTLAAAKLGIKHKFCLVEGLGSAYTSNSFKSRILRFVLENLYKIALKKADACIFVSDGDADFFAKKGLLAENKIARIKSVGVDCADFSDENSTFAPEIEHLRDKKIILMAARALVDKGVGEFYEAARILRDRKDCAFVFVGSGVDGKKGFDDEFLDTCENVTRLKWSNNVKGLLKACYIYALPSYREGFPRTILEAMAMGKPCVASNVPGCCEAVNEGVSGLLCKARDPKDLALKISNLLDDENLAKQMGQNARKIALEKYDEKVVIAKYLEFYESCGILVN